MDKQVVDLILEDLRELKADVKLLLADRNKRIGTQIVISAIFSVIFGLIIALIEHK